MHTISGGRGEGSGVWQSVYSLLKIVTKELRTVFWCASWSCWIRCFWQEMLIHSAVLEGPARAHRLTCHRPVQVLEVLLWVMWMSQSHFRAVTEAEVCSFIALQCELWSFGLCVAGGCVWRCWCLLWNAQQQVEAPTAVWGLWLVHFRDCFHPLMFTFPFLPPLLASCFPWQALWAPLKVCMGVMLWALSSLPLEMATNSKWSLFSAAAPSVIRWTPELVGPFSSMQLFLKLCAMLIKQSAGLETLEDDTSGVSDPEFAFKIFILFWIRHLTFLCSFCQLCIPVLCGFCSTQSIFTKLCKTLGQQSQPVWKCSDNRRAPVLNYLCSHCCCSAVCLINERYRENLKKWQFSYKMCWELIYGLFLSLLHPSWSAFARDVQPQAVRILSWGAGSKCEFLLGVWLPGEQNTKILRHNGFGFILWIIIFQFDLSNFTQMWLWLANTSNHSTLCVGPELSSQLRMRSCSVKVLHGFISRGWSWNAPSFKVFPF